MLNKIRSLKNRWNQYWKGMSTFTSIDNSIKVKSRGLLFGTVGLFITVFLTNKMYPLEQENIWEKYGLINGIIYTGYTLGIMILLIGTACLLGQIIYLRNLRRRGYKIVKVEENS